MFHGLKILSECPEWPLISAYGPGKTPWQKMCSAIAETFSATEYGDPTHVHFYASQERAEELWKGIELPNTIETVSFRPEEVKKCYEYFAMRGKEYTVDSKPVMAYGPVEALRLAHKWEKDSIEIGDVITICMDSEPKGRWSYRVDEGVFTLVGEWGI